jgi:pimeloyl-ACP methyl ester carboxylesterase
MATAIEAAPDLRAHFGGLVRAMLPGHPEEAALLLDAIAATEKATFAQGARELFAYAGADLLPAITTPVLAVCGADDDLFTLPAAQAIARGVPDGRAGAIGRAGHAPYLDRPQPFAAVVAEFWAEVDAG